MAKLHKLHLNKKDLISRGWTLKGIDEAFKEPDKYEPKTKDPLFLRKRVQKIEKIYGVI